MSNALLGHGITWGIWDGASAYDIVGELIDLSPPNAQSDDVDVTHYASPNKTREYIKGLTDPGDASLTINWVPGDATDIIIQALNDSGAVRSQQITWPNGVIWTFDGFVKGFEPSPPIDDKMTATISIRVTGSKTIS